MTGAPPTTDPDPDEALARSCLARLDNEGARRHARLALARADPNTALWLRYRYLSDYEAVITLGEALLAANPADLSTLLHMGRASYLLGRRHESLAMFARMAEHAPERPDVVYALADLLLLAGDTEAGWRRLDSLANQSLMAAIDPRLGANLERYWRGQPLAGKTILVVNYLGIGDNLMMARYARDLTARGARVTFVARPEVYRLLVGLVGADRVKNTYFDEPWSGYDYWTFDYLVPRWLGANRNVIPAYPGGYIAKPPALAPPKAPGRLRVGLCATTGIDHFTSTARFLSPEDLQPLAGLTHIDWVWVQTAARHENFEARSGLALESPSPDWVDFYDAARVMAGLDLVISICSGPLHLAAAMGLPVWGLICAAPDWRWGTAGTTSAWYPNLTLYRQQRLGDWSTVIAQVKLDLAAYGVGGSTSK
jgi:hypothetical protein